MPPFSTLTPSAIPVKVVDIGANPIDGRPPYAPLMESGATTVIGFEPNPEALAKLNAAKGPDETYLPYAVGDGQAHTLHFCQAPGMTSLLTPNPTVLNLFHGFPDWGRVLATETVTTVRLDDIPETAGSDLLKIDIQGAELMVMQNATERLKDFLVIQTEVEFLPLYQNQPLFTDVDLFLRQHGFVFHRFFPTVSRVFQPLVVDNNIYAGLSQLVWADAIFVRDFTQLDGLTPIQILKMSRILHDVYQSVDLVMHLLRHYDARTNSTLAGHYMTLLGVP